MNEETYFSKLLENYPEKKQFFEWMKFELDGRVYYYGEHFRFPYEDSRLSTKWRNYLRQTKRLLTSSKKTYVNDYNGSILSEAYFTINEEIAKATGIKVYKFPWRERTDFFSNKDINETITQISTLPFNILISDVYCKQLQSLYEAIRDFVRKKSIKLVVFPNDLAPINRIAIDACKEAGIPTAIYLHGLPGRYDSIDDNRADFLCVWGEGIKDQYIKQGVNPNKIIITGHPSYSKVAFPRINNITLDSPLVLTNSVNGAPSTSDCYRLSDRGICINHAWSVEKALTEIGINHAVLRLHPSERPEWYMKYIDTRFYTIDVRNLTESLKQSSIIIGPTSTVAMDAATCGIPYFCFEQELKYSNPLVPPFDGSEEEFPIALTVNELVNNIKSNRCMQPGVFKKYIASSFDITKLTNYLN